MDKNRAAFVTLHTVPEGYSGRAECSGVITVDGRLIKQNLELILVNTDFENDPFSLLTGNTDRLLYHVSFYDDIPVFNRMEEIAKKYQGTHTRRTGKDDYDSGSFRILDRDMLIEYLNQIAYPKPGP